MNELMNHNTDSRLAVYAVYTNTGSSKTSAARGNGSDCRRHSRHAVQKMTLHAPDLEFPAALGEREDDDVALIGPIRELRGHSGHVLVMNTSVKQRVTVPLQHNSTVL